MRKTTEIWQQENTDQFVMFDNVEQEIEREKERESGRDKKTFHLFHIIDLKCWNLLSFLQNQTWKLNLKLRVKKSYCTWSCFLSMRTDVVRLRFKRFENWKFCWRTFQKFFYLIFVLQTFCIRPSLRVFQWHPFVWSLTFFSISWDFNMNFYLNHFIVKFNIWSGICMVRLFL